MDSEYVSKSFAGFQGPVSLTLVFRVSLIMRVVCSIQLNMSYEVDIDESPYLF